MLSKNSFSKSSEPPRNIFVYVGEKDSFKTNICLRIISSNLVRTFLESRTGYSLIIMDVNKFRAKQTLFNDFDVEHPRVLKKMMVYPVSCLEDIRLLIASLIKLQTPPIQILVDGIDGFCNNSDSSSGAIDAGVTSTLFLLNEYAQVSMADSDVEKKVIVNYCLARKDEIVTYEDKNDGNGIYPSSSDKKARRMDAEDQGVQNNRASTTSGKDILASLAVVDIGFLAKLSKYAVSIIQVYRDLTATEWPRLLERKLVIEDGKFKEEHSADRDVRDLNELFLKMQMAADKRQEDENKQIDEELKC